MSMMSLQVVQMKQLSCTKNNQDGWFSNGNIEKLETKSFAKKKMTNVWRNQPSEDFNLLCFKGDFFGCLGC